MPRAADRGDGTDFFQDPHGLGMAQDLTDWRENAARVRANRGILPAAPPRPHPAAKPAARPNGASRPFPAPPADSAPAAPAAPGSASSAGPSPADNGPTESGLGALIRATTRRRRRPSPGSSGGQG